MLRQKLLYIEEKLQQLPMHVPLTTYAVDLINP